MDDHPPGRVTEAGSKDDLDVGLPQFQLDIKCPVEILTDESRTRGFLKSCTTALLMLRFTVTLVALWLVAGSLATVLLEKRASITQSTYDDLVRYTKYSSGAYQLLCVKPLGNTLVQSVS